MIARPASEAVDHLPRKAPPEKRSFYLRADFSTSGGAPEANEMIGHDASGGPAQMWSPTTSEDPVETNATRAGRPLVELPTAGAWTAVEAGPGEELGQLRGGDG